MTPALGLSFLKVKKISDEFEKPKETNDGGILNFEYIWSIVRGNLKLNYIGNDGSKLNFELIDGDSVHQLDFEIR